MPIAYVADALFMYRYGSHDSISVAYKNDTLERTKQRLRVIEKHRAWLGERAYRERLAVYILRYVSWKTERWQTILYAFRRAGPRATVKDLVAKLFRAMRRDVPRS
jgi:hypothetical protein